MEPDELRVAAEFAALAPSVHNIQPWTFVAGPNFLEIHLDPNRALRCLDPQGRQVHLSCGIVAEFSRLGIRSLGSACAVRLMPDPTRPLVVAKLEVGRREPISPSEQRLVEAVGRRYTDRGAYTDQPVAPGLLQAMRQAVADQGCWLHVLNRRDDRLSAIRLLAKAEAIEAADPAFRAELKQWVRQGTAEDGLPEPAFRRWEGTDRVSEVPLRDFTGGDVHPHPGGDEPPTVERDTLVLVGTDLDVPASWLRAGRAAATLLLTLTADGLVSQPLGPVLDLPTTRAELRRELGLVGFPQLLLRLGYGARRPATGRRRINDMFTVTSAP